LMRDEWAQWVDGSADDAFGLCRPCQGELTVDHSAMPWAKARTAAAAQLI